MKMLFKRQRGPELQISDGAVGQLAAMLMIDANTPDQRILQELHQSRQGSSLSSANAANSGSVQNEVNYLFDLMENAMASQENHFSPFTSDPATVSTNIVEILFVFCTLLSSKRRVEIQDELGRLGIVDLISTMMDNLNWSNCNTTTMTDETILANDYDSALKIQLLRVILNFCDRDSDNIHNKSRLILEEEIFAMKRNFCVPVLANHWYGYDHDCPIDPATLTKEKFAQYARHLTLEPNPNQGTDSAHICASFADFPKTPRTDTYTTNHDSSWKRKSSP
eukprot:CAMPEP_0115047090 /NCGR_PEP_ID=MMETSP0216-20121206/49118_1 /TAXON_ID=223996 /ORGANISM="Protocruzia adherens, Strain Boccale" /LENGTH=279 /DNA_ID=CAMNT_0002430257 /DNA_START=30 /DNA_END=869 /DNA_ORIENTATION=-